MTTTDQQQDATAEPDRSWLDADVDGRPVRFWIGAGLVIAAETLGFGAWWVWGLDRGMSMADGTGMDGSMDGSTADMASTEARLPPVAGLYDGEQVFFVHPEASDPDVADVFPSAPGDDAYRPLRTIVLVEWVDDGRARLLGSSDEVTAAADAGDVVPETTDVVVNMPFLTWPTGQR